MSGRVAGGLRFGWVPSPKAFFDRAGSFVKSRQRVEPMLIEPDLARVRSRRALGLASMATEAFWSARFRKIVIGGLTWRPALAGLFVLVVPRLEETLPVFHAGLLVEPKETSASIELYSPRFSSEDYLERYGTPFAELQESHRGLQAGGETLGSRRQTGTVSGFGLSIRIPGQAQEPVVGALLEYLDRYIDLALECAVEENADGDVPEREGETEAAAISVCLDAPFSSPVPLEKLFGRSWVERYDAFLRSP